MVTEGSQLDFELEGSALPRAIEQAELAFGEFHSLDDHDFMFYERRRQPCRYGVQRTLVMCECPLIYDDTQFPLFNILLAYSIR